MNAKDIIRSAERVLDRALDQAAIAGAAIRFAEAGELELAQRASKILQAELKGQQRRRCGATR